MEITARDFKDYFILIVNMIEEQKDYLCELDRRIGDGDHGVTMSIGWQAVHERLLNELAEEEDSAKISLIVGKTFLNAVGSSVGPLYATGFMRGAKTIKNKSTVHTDDLVAYWLAFARGIKERGRSEVGDKTMVDTLEPFAKMLETKYKESNDFIAAYSEAIAAAKEGMESTKDLVSRKGRSSRLGERSVGALDPGATSAYFILATFLDFVEAKKVKAS
ncbi:dihydroxyacetone kinase subunit L [Virgibacillus sp. AGTR]|uniref:dihydroxyacetone kinase subunit DhaL n=1 Tax=Virgibacillus sp. AGTR TaxID=2812055 RepID=UPI001962A23A|nr:dihydroxyacetone kinase subunit DhaL [Virgibacillus sp. AGTR]MCC2250009.1 dihydroxyacetone kinase subunit L [Virgibacillus sp. AGTR]QRZ18137.1 dihydroxyacetone kinase subunit L [Virgibacillus sp. AGTR]